MTETTIYDKTRRFPVIAAIAVLLITTVLLLGSRAASAAPDAAAAFITAYPIPTAGSEPTNIIALAPGQVWYTMQNANAIGKLVVAGNGQGTHTKYDVPTANSAPYDLAWDGQYIWFTERLGNKIGRLNPANGAITEYTIPTANSRPMGIAIAPNGDVWFAENGSDKMARFKPASGTFDEYSFTTAGAKPEDVATSSNDSIWFTAPGLKSVIRLLPNKPQNQRFEQVPVLDFSVPPWEPGSIAVVDSFPADYPWITGPSKNYVGRYSPGTLGYWRWYALNNQNTDVKGIFLQQSGNKYYTWFTEPKGNRAGLLITHKEQNQVITLFEMPLPGSNPRPAGIVADTGGTAWIAAPGTNAILAWRAPYFNQVFLPAASRPGP